MILRLYSPLSRRTGRLLSDPAEEAFFGPGTSGPAPLLWETARLGRTTLRLEVGVVPLAARGCLLGL